jgi:maltose alpha-D-glucosyltransferase/alpha-amylase
VSLPSGWASAFRGPTFPSLDQALRTYLTSQRWYGGKARSLRSIRILDAIPFSFAGSAAQITLVRTEFTEGTPETYVLPLALASVERIARAQIPETALIARVDAGDGNGVLYDPTLDHSFGHVILGIIGGRKRLPGSGGAISGVPSESALRTVAPDAQTEPSPTTKFEQSNSSIVFGRQTILKLFRRMEPGISLDVEVGRFLTEKVGFPHTPAFLGTLEYEPARGEKSSLALWQRFVSSEGDAWSYTQDALSEYFARAAATEDREQPPHPPEGALAWLEPSPPPPGITQRIGPYLASARLLGARTGELHVALASIPHDPTFSPEPFDAEYQRALGESIRTHARESLRLLQHRLDYLPAAVTGKARALLGREGLLMRRIDALLGRPLSAVRIRCHGDYHLGQALYTGEGYVILDFEGEPARPIHERRVKHSPLQDVAGMLRSYDYAAQAAQRKFREGTMLPEQNDASLARWSDLWQRWVSAAFLQGYLSQVAGTPAWPAARQDLQNLLDVLILDKALYELRYELNNRPDWSLIPVASLLRFTASSVS